MDLDVTPFTITISVRDCWILPMIQIARAVADISATLQRLSLEQTEMIMKDGIAYVLIDFEEESDWALRLHTNEFFIN
ncbi:hypothetical protein I4X03_021915 [Massilia sp. R798]|uniref:DUF1902 domain-containing protein n=2 Tax=Massilia soli TaxID=2792854 RepID=A0ABS7SVE7_9BURK|nr:hypothetical protein [Massilia soli]